MKLSETKRRVIVKLADAWGDALVKAVRTSKEPQTRRLEIRTKLAKAA